MYFCQCKVSNLCIEVGQIIMSFKMTRIFFKTQCKEVNGLGIITFLKFKDAQIAVCIRNRIMFFNRFYIASLRRSTISLFIQHQRFFKYRELIESDDLATGEEI